MGYATGPLAVGQAFGPRYHIIRVLGAGGMGVVYQAWDAELGVAVALKVIRTETLTEPGTAGEVERRFKRELLLARQVTHKHVVRIHDLGELDGIKYLTMPFVEGENLADLLKTQGKLPIPQVLTIAKEVASGLAAAHEVGVVHCDLKPENIMIAAEGGALIMDFGISRSTIGAGAATAMGAVMGTLEYMAPEQAQGAAVDQRADMYSFGLVVYDMLLGRQRLARRDNPMTELMGRMQHPPPAVRTLDETVPDALETVVMRCLQPLPEDRYATTAELVAALDLLTEDGHQMELPKPPSRVLTMSLAAMLVLVLAAGGTWFWKYGAGYAPPTDPVSVLIANFDNRAKDPVFDGLVEQALGVGIEGASFVTAYPRPQALRLVNTLKLGPLGEDNARIIANREGIKRVVSGSIESTGDQRYKLSVKILDPTDGKALLTWDTTANGKDKVLDAVGRLAAKVRNGLGDRSASTRTLKDGETFTAATLEAAHEYVSAQELQAEGKYDLALAGYKKAVDADPKLGRAYAGLGAVSASLGKPDEAQAFYETALGLLDRMTDREKYRTQAGYYLLMKDSDKAKTQLEALLKAFPADSTALTNLAYVSFLRRDMGTAMDLGGKASAIYPNNVLRRNNLALYAMYAGQFDVAEKEAKRVIELNKEFAKAYLVMAISQLGLGRPADAEATWQLLHALSATGSDFAAHGRADMAVYEGRLSDASRILEEAIKSPPEGRSAVTTARFIVSLAEVRHMQGHDADAVKLAEEALAKSTDQTIALFAGRVFVSAGRSARAQTLAADLGKGLDREALMVGKVLEGEVDLKRDDFRSAVQHFKEANALGDSWLTLDGLGRAYLAAGAYPDAQTEFDLCLKRNGEATAVMLDDVPTYRLAATSRYYMGRAQEGLKSASAIDSYKTFLAIKQKGDEQGLVADARRRVAALPSR